MGCLNKNGVIPEFCAGSEGYWKHLSDCKILGIDIVIAWANLLHEKVSRT